MLIKSAILQGTKKAELNCVGTAEPVCWQVETCRITPDWPFKLADSLDKKNLMKNITLWFISLQVEDDVNSHSSARASAASMERLHWVQHRCRQLLARDSERGWYSTPNGLPTKSTQDAHSSPQRVSGKRRRVFARNGPHQQEYEAFSKGYKGNAIRTTKYSLLTFIPMNLFQQFHRSDFYLCKHHYRNVWNIDIFGVGGLGFANENRPFW